MAYRVSKRLLIGQVGHGLLVLAAASIAAPLSGKWPLIVGSGLLGLALVSTTQIFSLIRDQARARDSITEKSMTHRRILGWSRLVLVTSLAGVGLVLGAHYLDGAMGLSAFRWWLAGTSIAMISVAIGNYLTVQEAKEIASAGSRGGWAFSSDQASR